MTSLSISKIMEYRNRKNNLNPCTGATLKGLVREFRDVCGLDDKNALRLLSGNTTTDDMLALIVELEERDNG